MNKRMPTSVPAEKISQLTALRDSISMFAEWKRLYHCSAWYYTTEDYVFLKSYNTIVAVYERATGITYVYGRWSATTYQHVRKFRNLMWEKYNAAEIGGLVCMTELEAIAMVFGIPIAQAKEIYVNDIPDEVYEDVLKLMLMDEESDRRN